MTRFQGVQGIVTFSSLNTAFQAIYLHLNSHFTQAYRCFAMADVDDRAGFMDRGPKSGQ
jgi:hypothetical protein